MVVAQGDIGGDFYFISEGAVEVFTQTATGETLRLRTLENGSYFGEIALLENRPRTATVRTLTPCKLVTLTRAEFLDLLQTNPRFEQRIEQETVLLLRASQGVE